MWVMWKEQRIKDLPQFISSNLYGITNGKLDLCAKGQNGEKSIGIKSPFKMICGKCSCHKMSIFWIQVFLVGKDAI